VVSASRLASLCCCRRSTISSLNKQKVF
jgi:hypothetical protein